MRTPLFVGLAALLASSACARAGAGTGREEFPTSGTATILDASGRSLGTLSIREDGSGITASGTLRGLTPGLHGIHVHTVGRCEAPFASAGGHWNPTARLHGFDNPLGPHMGDMRNLEVGPDGTATVQLRTAGGSLTGAGGLLDADGASIVVHAGIDDYRSDPAGGSGARVACGVITPAIAGS